VTGDLTVRPARLDDLQEVVELRLALLREYSHAPMYEHLRPDAETRARELFSSQLLSPSETMLLAVRHSRIVGILRCVDTVGSPLVYPDRYCYVSSVYVRPRERRNGVLRALVTAAEQWCAERGIGEMRLHNSLASPIAADVWDAFGFEVVEHVRRRVLSDPLFGDVSRRHAHSEGGAY
jgi:GNAT superfamily N-acetyltransferase